MSFITPEFTRLEVNRAGTIIARFSSMEREELQWANSVLANWRGSHAYPVNTFQATLRSRLKQIDSEALVAQRLKRTPSIIAKLQRFESMKLAQMQDIGGLRAVVGSTEQLDRLVKAYSSKLLDHAHVHTKDYVAEPKTDGYRSVHLVYKYHNAKALDYDGLSIELQMRTKVQHAWATAVETMGTYLGQALKSGQGDEKWKEFFRIASAALTHLENKPHVPGFDNTSKSEIFASLKETEHNLKVLNNLRGFAIATDKIIQQGRATGTYHLIVLNAADRSVTIRAFSKDNLEDATKQYTQIEDRTNSGESLEAVLVSAGPINALKRAYPNYFLDTQLFIDQMERIINPSVSKKH